MPTQITVRSRFWMRALFTFLGLSGLLLGVSSVYGGVIVIEHSGPEPGKLLGGILCCVVGAIMGFIGFSAFFVNLIRMVDGQ